VAAKGNKDAEKNRGIVAAKMTPAQIAEAQKLAREWKAQSAPRMQAQTASTDADGSCMKIESLFKERLPHLGGSLVAYQLKRDGQAWHLVFTQKGNNAKWLIASRFSPERPDIYCVQATGSRVELLKSLHESKFSEQFGMPGSNNPRCGSLGDPLQSLKVRAWASRELGDSLILGLSEPAPKMPNFTLLLSKTDGYWILLDEKPQATTCYFDRGQLSDFKDIQLK
jgi:hypothetical protein